MSEIAEFIHRNAARVTPKILHGIHHKLPQLKLEFAEIHAPKFPHLMNQLEFLADVVEDSAENADGHIPFITLAEACFALAYAHKQINLIPDHVPGVGFADESSVVRAVLIRNERSLAEYARRQGLDWDSITIEA